MDKVEIDRASLGVPAHWLNVAVRSTRVRKGDSLSVAVEGGWVSRPAPCDGLIYEVADGHSFYVPTHVSRGPARVIPIAGEASPASAEETGRGEGNAEEKG